MISRIRVEARAASMDEAQREIELVLGHAHIAALLEGVAGGMSGPQFTDSHFGEKYGNDLWNQNGLRFEGRMALTFEASPDPGGGLKQYSFRVVKDYSDQNIDPNIVPNDDGKDVSDTVFVLDRIRPVTREHSWDGLPPSANNPPEGTADAEAVLDNIRRLVNVRDLVVQPVVGGWNVSVITDSGSVDETDPVLREAALRAYGRCGVPVMHFDTIAAPVRETTTG